MVLENAKNLFFCGYTRGVHMLSFQVITILDTFVATYARIYSTTQM